LSELFITHYLQNVVVFNIEKKDNKIKGNVIRVVPQFRLDQAYWPVA